MSFAPCPDCGCAYADRIDRVFDGAHYRYEWMCVRCTRTVIEPGGTLEVRGPDRRDCIRELQRVHYDDADVWLKAGFMLSAARPGVEQREIIDAQFRLCAPVVETARAAIGIALSYVLTVPEHVAFDVFVTAQWEPIADAAARSQLAEMFRRAEGQQQNREWLEKTLFDDLFGGCEVTWFSNVPYLKRLHAGVFTPGATKEEQLQRLGRVAVYNADSFDMTVGQVLAWPSWALVGIDREVLACAFEP